MKKLLAVTFMVLLVAGSLFAGGATDTSATKGATMIGLAMPETHVLRWIKDGRDLVTHASSRGYVGLVNWANADQPTQNQQIQGFLTQGAKLLIIGCINEGVAPIVAEAKRDKVPVIAYDRIIFNSADYDYYITFNNFKVGELQGQAIVDALRLDSATAAAPKRITLFAGSPTDGNAGFFFDGAMSKLNPYIDKGVLQVVGPFPKTSADKANFLRIATEGWQGPIAKTRMENLLTGDARSVTLDAVLAPNDTLARAIIEACRADSKYRTTLPFVTGQDAEFASMMSIKNGEQGMTVFKDTSKLAEAAMILADAILKGQTPNIPGAVLASSIGLASIGDTTDKGEYKAGKTVTAYLLDPISVNRSNILVPVNAGFYAADEEAQIRR